MKSYARLFSVIIQYQMILLLLISNKSESEYDSSTAGGFGRDVVALPPSNLSGPSRNNLIF